MKIRAGFLIIFCIFFSFFTFFLTNSSIDRFLSLEAGNRGDFRLELLKNEITKYAGTEDDITLNNFIGSLTKQPEILKATISRQGRVIADSNPDDINAESSLIQSLTPEEIRKKILLQKEEFKFPGKEFILTLKINNNYSKPLKDSLMLSLGISCAIFLLIISFVFFPAKDNYNRQVTSENKKENIFSVEEESLLNSESAVVLILSGDNKVLKASKKAFELFSADIEGKYITEIRNFNLVADYLSKGKKPFTKDGKKYFII